MSAIGFGWVDWRKTITYALPERLHNCVRFAMETVTNVALRATDRKYGLNINVHDFVVYTSKITPAQFEQLMRATLDYIAPRDRQGTRQVSTLCIASEWDLLLN